MKKHFALTLATIALTFTACGGNTEKKAAATSAVEASSAKAVSNLPVMTFDKTSTILELLRKENVSKHFHVYQYG